MSPEGIRDALTAKPFQPFDLVLSDGQTFTITHPDWVSVPPFPFAREVAVFTQLEGETESYHTQWLNLGQVLKLVIPAAAATRPPAAGPEGNGA
jgi:hypothetical protein